MRNLVFFVFFVFFACPALADEAVIGTVMEVEGAPVIRTETGRVMAAAIETPVHPGDIIATGSGGRAMILFIDDTELTLSENTELTVDNYVFNPEDASGNRAVYNVLRGAFYYVSGLIAKKPDPDVTVKTLYGSIGVRGTQFWGGDIDGEYGVLVNEGQVEVTGKQGSVRLDRGQGAAIHGAGSDLFRPKVWASEKIMRATRTIALKRAAEVRQRIAGFKGRQMQLRAIHRSQIKERLRERGIMKDPGRFKEPRDGKRMKGLLDRSPVKAYGKN